MTVFRGNRAVTLTIAIVTAALVAPPSPADGPPELPRDLAFRNFDSLDGLAHDTVFSITQADPGFIWIATANGVSRYDGLESVNYRHDPEDPTSLSGGLTRDLAVDHDGTIWIATWAEGLNRYVPEIDGFDRIVHDSGDPASLAEDSLRSLYVDRDNNLWVGGLSRGLSRLGPDRAGFAHFSHDPDDPGSLSSNHIEVIRQDREGYLWVGTNGGGLNRLDPKSGTFTRLRHDPSDPSSLANDDVRSILEDRDGRLWIGTWGGGLDLLDRETGSFTHYRHDRNNPESLPDDHVRPLIQDQQGTIWIGSAASGVGRFDPSSGSFISSPHDPTVPRGVSHSHVRALLEDRQGGIWLGTAGGGLDRLDLIATAFVAESGPGGTGLPPQMVGGSVFALAAAGDEELWLGANGHGLARFSTAGTTLFRHDPNDPSSLGQDSIFALVRDRRGVLWIGTETNGLDRLEPGRRSFRHYRHDPGNPGSLSHNAVLSLLEDRQGVLWVGTAGGLNRFDAATGEFEKARHDANDADSLSSSHVLGLAEDLAGGLWVGTDGEGLNHLSPQERTKPLAEARWERSLPSWRVNDLLVDRAGRLWIAANDGRVARLDMQSGAIAEFGERQGLSSGAVLSLVEDDGGALWAGLLTGLARFDEQSGTFLSYTRRDGLAVESMAPRAAATAFGGVVFFGAFGGLVSVDYQLVQPDSRPSPIALEARLGDRHISSLSRSEPDGATDYGLATLSSTEKRLELSFAALDFEAPWRYRYRYMLEGFDNEWNETDSEQRSAAYTNLPPGRYVFRVQAARLLDHLSAAGATLGVRVLPSWWQTWWLRSTAAFAALGLVVLVVRLRTRRLARRARLLQREAEELERSAARLTRSLGAEARVRRKLEASEAQGTATLDSLASPVLLLGPGGTIRRVNETWRRFGRERGASPDVVAGVGLNYLDECRRAVERGADNAAECLAGLESLFAGESASFDMEYPCHGPQKQRWYLLRAVPLSTAEGGLVLSHIDITEAKLAEQERRERELRERQQRGELAHLQRIAAMGELTGALSHEISQPLTAIRSNTDAALRFLSRDQPNFGEVYEILEDIAHDNRRVAEVIHNLRGILKGQVDDVEPIDVNELVEKTVVLLHSDAVLKRVTMEQELADDLPRTSGNFVQLQQVLVNLMLNGLEAMEGVPEAERRLVLSTTTADEGTVVVAVGDTGHGLGEQGAGPLFATFHTTKPQGLGLGLSISRSIVEAHGGAMLAENNPDRGATFRFTLPAWNPSEDASGD